MHWIINSHHHGSSPAHTTGIYDMSSGKKWFYPNLIVAMKDDEDLEQFCRRHGIAYPTEASQVGVSNTWGGYTAYDTIDGSQSYSNHSSSGYDTNPEQLRQEVNSQWNEPRCECGTHKTYGKDCEANMHFNWCPVYKA